MIITCPPSEIAQAHPSHCKCQKSRLHRHGSYERVVSGEIAVCFFCRRCKTHVTIIPSTCVPHKHHPLSTIEPALDAKLAPCESQPEAETWVYPSTVARWIKEFSSHLSVLATEGARRLGIKPLCGSLQTVRRSTTSVYWR